MRRAVSFLDLSQDPSLEGVDKKIDEYFLQKKAAFLQLQNKVSKVKPELKGLDVAEFFGNFFLEYVSIKEEIDRVIEENESRNHYVHFVYKNEKYYYKTNGVDSEVLEQDLSLMRQIAKAQNFLEKCGFKEQNFLINSVDDSGLAGIVNVCDDSDFFDSQNYFDEPIVLEEEPIPKQGVTPTVTVPVVGQYACPTCVVL